MGGELSETAIFNLAKAEVAIIDDCPFSMQITAQALNGFGVRVRHQFNRASDAMEFLTENPVDLLIVDCEMPDVDGYDLVNWLRRSKIEANAYAPVIMISGHTRRSKVAKARDCGASFMVTKPFSPLILLERIIWVARDGRPFLQAGDYIGPDRRFRDDGPPQTGERRRMARTPQPPPPEPGDPIEESAA